MTTVRDEYGDLLLLTPHGWKFVDESDFEESDPCFHGGQIPCEDCEEDCPMRRDNDN